jgi:protocatechuate 3,4-dioxygenase beta subunit
MKRIAMFVAPLVALVVSLSLAQHLKAADAPAPGAATGTVSVTVTDKDGKPVEGATVRITESNKTAKSGSAEPKLADAGAAKEKAAPIAEGKTDKDGKAKLENIAAGSYNLSANLKGTGNARQKITVKAGETLDVALKLAPRNTTAK